jgi:hypothetical protein
MFPIGKFADERIRRAIPERKIKRVKSLVSASRNR